MAPVLMSFYKVDNTCSDSTEIGMSMISVKNVVKILVKK